jgi:hypothetical protein
VAADLCGHRTKRKKTNYGRCVLPIKGRGTAATELR